MFKFAGILFLCDALAAFASYLFGQFIRFGQFVGLVGDSSVSALGVAIYIVTVFLASYFCELYTGDRYLERTEMAARVAVSLMLAFIALSAVFYAAPEMALGRGVLSLSLLSFGVMQYLIHRTFQGFQNSPHLAQKIMILGTGPLAEVIARAIPVSPHNFAFAGFIQPANDLTTVPSDRIVGTLEEVESLLSDGKISKLVISMTERRGNLPVKNLLTCKLRGVDIIDSPTFYETLTGKLLVENIHPSWFIYSSGFRVTSFRRACKRALDILLSIVGIILVLPALPVIALLIKATSPGPVLFRQKRVGEGGCEFTLMKFRTMRNDAEEATGPVWAKEDDPRITKLGCWLRKTRIDEIPQMFNVLKGEMSFIGPRPERPEFVEQLSETIPYYGKRHFVRPGITGWAQVKYRYGASEEDALEKLRYDLYYIKNYSLILDLMIVLETIKVVLFRRGGR
jgi:sugar transferase (PEP-CTERM system associated)